MVMVMAGKTATKGIAFARAAFFRESKLFFSDELSTGDDFGELVVTDEGSKNLVMSNEFAASDDFGQLVVAEDFIPSHKLSTRDDLS